MRALLLLVAIVVPLLAGCSQPARQDADAIVVALQADAKTLDPHRAVDAASIRVIENLYESLLRWGEPWGEVAPGLASRWSIENEGRTVRLSLRPHARFHDGTPVTAADVAWSIERIRREAIRAAHFEAVRAIDTPDDHTVVLHLDRPFAPLLTYLAHPLNAVVNRRVVEAHGGLDRVDGGSGPFTLVEWKKDRHVELRAVGEGPRRLLFRPIPDELSRRVALRTGQVDLVLDVPGHDVPILEADGGIEIQSVPGTFWEYLGMNCRKPPFDDVRVRQAVAAAIDREQVVHLVKRGHAEPLYGGHIPAGHWAHLQGERRGPDLAQARALLQAAGHPDGFSTTLRVGSAFPYQVRAAEVVKQQLARVGIRVALRAEESSLFFDALGRSDFDLALAGWVGFVDPDEWTYELFHSAGRYNQQQCADPALDALLDEGRRTLGDAERRTIYLEAQRRVLAQAPLVFLHLNPQISAWRKDLFGYRVHPTASTESLRRVERR